MICQLYVSFRCRIFRLPFSKSHPRRKRLRSLIRQVLPRRNQSREPVGTSLRRISHSPKNPSAIARTPRTRTLTARRPASYAVPSAFKEEPAEARRVIPMMPGASAVDRTLREIAVGSASRVWCVFCFRANSAPDCCGCRTKRLVV